MVARCPRWRNAGSMTPIPVKSQGLAVIAGSKKTYQPYVTKGSVTTAGGTHRRRLDVLRDTGSSHSLIERKMLPNGDRSFTGKSIAIRGVENRFLVAPVHRVRLDSKWKSGIMEVAVVDRLPIQGVSFLLGNDHGTSPLAKNARNGKRRGTPKEPRGANMAECAKGGKYRPSEATRGNWRFRKEINYGR